jgi:predicted phosphate transport protein (TIGR00153 family)
MFAWFQKLLPRTGDFFAQFEAHSATLIVASNALTKLMQGGPDMAAQIKLIEDEEHKADMIIRDVLTDVRKTFLTPFDRSAITALIAVMDDAIDQMHQTSGAVELYSVTEFDPEMQAMAAIIQEASALVAKAMPMLRNISANARALHELTGHVVKLEGDADRLNLKGLKSLYEAHGKSDTIRFIVGSEIYSHLERVCDRLEDVANQIDGLVIDHA